MTEPRTPLPDARRTPRFAGLCTFARFPRLDDLKPGTKIDWAVLGVPHDGGVTFRPGARFGPRAIREASQYSKPFNLELDVNVAEKLAIADAGDVPVAPFSTKQTLDQIDKHCRSIHQSVGARFLMLGGDHSLAFAGIKAAWEQSGKPRRGIPMIHFDAHLDTVDRVWDEPWTHASPFRRAIEEGILDGSKSISIGIRGPLNRKDDLDFAKKAGLKLVGPIEARAKGESIIARHIASLKGAATYLTFDIDVVDPAFAPGTGTPCCGGLSSLEAISLLRAAKGVNLAGADVVEVLPDRDVSGITAMLAAQVAMEILSLAALTTKRSTGKVSGGQRARARGSARPRR